MSLGQEPAAYKYFLDNMLKIYSIPTIDTPHSDLGIEDAKPCIAKKSIVPPPSASDPMQMMQQMMRMFMCEFMGSMVLNCGPENHAPPTSPLPSVRNVPLSSPTSLKRPADNYLFLKNIDIEIWLAQLDADPVCGK